MVLSTEVKTTPQRVPIAKKESEKMLISPIENK